MKPFRKKKNDKIRVIRKAPGKAPEAIRIPNTLEALQAEVGGYIEAVRIASDCVIVCDEEGLLKNKPMNQTKIGWRFAGTVLLVGTRGEEFTDISITVDAAKFIL